MSAASAPTPAKMPSPIHPERGRRTAAFPIVMAASAITTPIPSSSTCLSLDPNDRIAKDFNHVGELSIAPSPTVITGEAAAFTHPATRWATPRATPAVTSPITGPSHRGDLRSAVSFVSISLDGLLFGARTLRIRFDRTSRSAPGRSPGPPRP